MKYRRQRAERDRAVSRQENSKKCCAVDHTIKLNECPYLVCIHLYYGDVELHFDYRYAIVLVEGHVNDTDRSAAQT